MGKFICLPVLMMLAGMAVHAQDKIITTSGDTILFRDVVYVSRTLAPAKPWLLSLSAGGAYLPWLFENVIEESVEYDDYKKLDKGFSLTANVHYLITDYVGFGVQYSFFTSGLKGNYPTGIDPNYPMYLNSNVRIRQYINYAGLSVFCRQFLDKNRKLSLCETLSGGLLLYRTEHQSKTFMPYYSYGVNSLYSVHFRYLNVNALATGDTFGATFGISAEYKILPYLSVGIGGNFLYGSLSKINLKAKNSNGDSDAGKLEESINLSRIDYSLVLRFHL